MTKTTGNFTDFLDFTRNSGGTCLRRIAYGSELVTNGDFDGNIDDFTSTGTATVTYDATEGAAKVDVTGSGGGIADDQTITVTSGKVYLVSVTLKKTTFSGDLHIQVEGTNIADFTPTTSYQTFTAPVVAGDSDLTVAVVRKNSPTGIFFVSNISVKEVTLDAPSGDLVLFNHPNNVPRVEYDADGNVKGLLIEEARTNVVAYSEDTSFWSEDGTTTITNRTQIAPDGTASATLVDIGSTGSGLGPNRISRFNSGLNASTKATVSVFLKKPDADAASHVNVRLYCSGSTPTDAYVDYDTSDFTSVNSSGHVDTVHPTENYGDGWYRVSFTLTLDSSATGSTNFRVGGRVNGSATGTDFIMWGAQVETGSFATSYIPTSGATATRSADIAHIDVDNFGHNKKVGTMVVDFEFKFEEGGSGFPRAIGYGSSSNSEQRVIIFVNESTQGMSASVVTNNVNQVSHTLQTSVTSPATGKVAFTFGDDDFAASRNGGNVKTDTVGDFDGNDDPRNVISMGGQTNNVANNINGTIKSFQYYPRRLTNAQLQELTS